MSWQPIEQEAGPPIAPVVDPASVDAHRAAVYQSYEKFLRARIGELDAARESRWSRDYSSIDAYLRSIEPMRKRFKQMLGLWIEPADRAPLHTRDRDTITDGDEFRAERFYFEILPGVESYAIELIPKPPIKSRAGLVVQHGYGGTPELACGFAATANDNDYSYRSLGIRAVRRGFHVIAPLHPTSYGTRDDVSANPPPGFEQQNRCYGKNRLHRLATLAGGSLIGLDMMTSSRAVDLLLAARVGSVGIYGLSQGGLTALYLSAMDQRVAAAVCSAWFTDRTPKMIGPHPVPTFLDSPEEDKFFRELIECFADDDMISLIAPRAVAIEAGLKDTSVDFAHSQKAFARARVHYERLGIASRAEHIAHASGHVSATRRAMEFLVEHLC